MGEIVSGKARPVGAFSHNLMMGNCCTLGLQLNVGDAQA